MNDFRSPFFKRTNRIVFTRSGAPYNPKKKKENHVIADIRDVQQIKKLYLCLEVNYDPDPKLIGWMSPPDYTITSMLDKHVVDYVNVVLRGWLRKPEWKSDFELVKYQDYQSWLLTNCINVPFN